MRVSNTEIRDQMVMRQGLLFPKMSASGGGECVRVNSGLRMMLLGRVRKDLASTR